MNTKNPLNIAAITLVLTLVGLAGCATSKQWSVSGADKSAGIVRVSYEYPEFKEPMLSDAQAAELAANRCDSWGYDAIEPIDGQIRQCANKNGDNCELWKVTREFLCRSGVNHGVAGVAGAPGSGAVANLSAR